MQVLLSAADRAIGRLDAATELLPNPNLFVAMYVRREALYSSQIEGITQASLSDVLEFEVHEVRRGRSPEIAEVINYIDAMNHGLERLKTLPVSLRLIREIHRRLLKGVRGTEREPGTFRGSQNRVGPPRCSISEAMYVPPPPAEAEEALADLENFLHTDFAIPPLLKCGLVHAQFESIHPFLDGNGRVGRLLITFQLCWQGILQRPLLYLSGYFRRHREEYYDRLQSVRDKDDWEGWLHFFFEGVRAVSLEAADTARKIQSLREDYRNQLGKKFPASALVLLDSLFVTPIINVNQVAESIGRSYPAANDLVSELERLGVLEEMTGLRRNRVYCFRPYLDLF